MVLAIFLGILDTLGESVAKTLFTHSQLYLALATFDHISTKTKHFATRMANVRKTVKNQSNDLKFNASGDNCADIFTKGLGKTKTQQHFAWLSAMRCCQRLPSASQGGNDWMVNHDPKGSSTCHMISHTQLSKPHSYVTVCAMQQTTLDAANFLLTCRYLSRCYIYPMLNYFYHQLQL